MNIEERKTYIENHKEKFKEQGKAITQHIIDLMMEVADDEITEHEYETFRKSEEKSLQKYLNSYTIEPTCDSEDVNGVDIREHLETIRHLEDHEEGLILYFKDNCVVEHETIKGTVGDVDLSETVYQKIMNKAISLGADIYVCHNHPISTYASPTEADKKNLRTVLMPTAEKNGVKVLGFGVVTFDDYYDIMRH